MVVKEHDSQRATRSVADIDPNGRGRPTALSDRVRALRLPDRVNSGAPRGTRLPWVLCLLLGLLCAVLGYQAYGRPPDKEPVTSGKDQGGPGSSNAGGSSAAIASSGEVVLESKGYIIPAHQIQVSPKISGMVVKLDIEEGKRVKKGDILAQLETVDYESDRDHAKAAVATAKHRLLELENGSRREEIAAARAELAESEAQLKQLFLDWKRSSTLKNSTALAVRDYELAQGAYEAMDRRAERLRQALELMVKGPRIERIDAARADLKQAEADLVKAEWRLDSCTIRAPVSGTILTKKAEEGNIVNPIAFNISASLCDLADLSDLEIELDIQERDVSKVVKDQRCKIRPEAFPDRVYEGRVSRLMPIANRSKGAVPVRVKVTVPHDEEGVYLKPEMGAVVSFLKTQQLAKDK
jgi:multidrug resistance efflux pump